MTTKRSLLGRDGLLLRLLLGLLLGLLLLLGLAVGLTVRARGGLLSLQAGNLLLRLLDVLSDSR